MKSYVIYGAIAAFSVIAIHQVTGLPSKSEESKKVSVISPQVIQSSLKEKGAIPPKELAKSGEIPVTNEDHTLKKINAAVVGKKNLIRSHKIDGKILGMTEILRLSTDQQEGIREILKEEDSEKNRMGVLIKNTQDKSEISRFRMEGAKAVLSTEEKIKSTLSPDQLDRYEVYKREVKQTEIEERVNESIASIAQNIILSSEQKDALFQIFSEAENRFDPIKLMSEGLSPEEARDKIDSDARNRLSEVMTPAQFELYQKQASERKRANEKLSRQD